MTPDSPIVSAAEMLAPPPQHISPIVGTSLTRSAEVHARELRQQQLRACLPPLRDALPPTSDVAERVLRNMIMSVDQQAAVLGTGLSRILKHPLPYDSANRLKPTLLLELMPSVGKTKLGDLAWEHLSSAYPATTQATPFVLVTGVSGMGKTKVAYDIGRTEAFVVIERVVERDALTPPWQAFLTFASEVVRTATSARDADCHCPLPLAERRSLKAALIVLLGAHLEWVVEVSEAAVGAECAVAMHNACSGSQDLERVLRELVLRAQRNGLAYVHVSALFRDTLCGLLGAPDTFGADGTLQLSEYSALQYLASVADRAMAVWGSCIDRDKDFMPRIVWAHDEVQALLHVEGLPRDLFYGVYEPHATATSPSSSCYNRGCFYGLLAAARDVVKRVRSSHLLLGNSMDLSAFVLERHSPAQGVAACVEEVVNLSVDDIREWLGAYLTADAIEGADIALLSRLSGRALFASLFWSALVARTSTSATCADNPATAVRGALTTAVMLATKAAERRIESLWDRQTPEVVSGQVPSRLLRYLFHELIMAPGGDGAVLDTTRMRGELLEAIQRGVLNANGGSQVIQLDVEPCTAAALRAVGMRRLARGNDGIMALLAARSTEPPGGEESDLGTVQEACFAWHLMRRCLLRNAAFPRMTLGELLEPYFTRVESTVDIRGNVHVAALPSACEEYDVVLTRGCRADGNAWTDRCPLELLDTENGALVHHTSSRMGGPDVMFLARHRDTGETRPVLLQLKNRATGSLTQALRSVNMEEWYAEGKAAGELRAHAHMRTVLAAHPRWALPIRVVASARPVDERVLLSTAWLNNTELADSPVLFLWLTRENMGVDIAPRDPYSPYTTTSTWPRCLWPTPVTRHWDPDVPTLPTVPLCPATPIVTTLQLKLTSRASKAAIEDAVQSLTLEAIEFVRHRKLLSRSNTITATFTCAATAFEAFRRGSEGTLIADGQTINAAFV